MHLAPQLIDLTTHLQLDRLVALYHLLEQVHELGFLCLELSLEDCLHAPLTIDNLGNLLLNGSGPGRLHTLLTSHCQASPAYRCSRRLASLKTVLLDCSLLLSRDRLTFHVTVAWCSR